MSTATTTGSQSLQDLLNNLFQVLTPKEATVIERRFALNGNQKQTLEKIGNHFKVTRERIRQIENIALSKLRRTVITSKLHEMNQMAKEILHTNGGVMPEDELISQLLLQISSTNEIDGAILRLCCTIDNEIVTGSKQQTFVPFWRLDSLSLDDLTTIINASKKILSKKKACLADAEIVEAVQEMKLFKDRMPSSELIISALKVDDRFKNIQDGWGLTDWRFVRPRSIRDKVEIILKKEGVPLHFMELANRIREAHFDHKNVTVQAVHNELIRYPQFVLVGRGLYALREWGYESGTVADVIERILIEKGPLTKKEIVNEVMKHRTVKVGTISLNLQKMPYFKRVGRAVYDFDASAK